MSEAPTPAVKLAFERELVTVAIDKLVPVKAMRANYKQSKKYLQILSSIKSIGIVEPPAIVADATRLDMFLLLDGHLRVEALKERARRMSAASSLLTMRLTPITSESTA